MKTLTFAEKALNFYKNLQAPENVPSGIQVLHPYRVPEVQFNVKKFLQKFYADRRERVYVLGINPGRFGGGLTGISFTDPVALEKYCGIKNTLEKRRELSSVFIYDFIEQWGGAFKFFKFFFLTAISPLGFTSSGINYNYYDNKKLLATLKPFIVRTLHEQIAIGAKRDAAILFGTGKNQIFFNELNDEYGFFKKIYALEHPRFIMQYQRKKIPEYFKRYQEVFANAI